MTDAGRDYYSDNEVRAILSSISRADQIKLRQIAHFQANKLRDCDADELLAEGVTRVFDGRRKWPRGLELAPFMKNVFGSIITAKAKHDAFASNYEVDVEVDIAGELDCPLGAVEASTHPDVVGGIYAQEMLHRLTVALADDQLALAVAMALAEGLTAKEAQNQFNMSANQYDAARKRLRRTVNTLSDKEVIA